MIINRYIIVSIIDKNNATLDYGTHTVNVYSDKPDNLQELIQTALTPVNFDGTAKEYLQCDETTLELAVQDVLRNNPNALDSA